MSEFRQRTFQNKVEEGKKKNTERLIVQDPPASDCQRCQIPGKKFFSFPKLQCENAEKCRVHTSHTRTETWLQLQRSSS